MKPLFQRVAGALSFFDNGVYLERLRLHVVKPQRYETVAPDLVREAIRQALRRGRSGIEAITDSKIDGDYHAVLLQFGFEVKCQLFTAECYIRRVMRSLMSDLDPGLNTRAADPAHVVPFSESLRSPVGRLCAEYMTDFPFAQAYLAGDLSICRLSKVLIEDGIVQGAIIISEQGLTATVHARVVRPNYPYGWAGTALLSRAVETAQQLGIRKLRFQFVDSNYDTVQFAKKVEAETLAIVTRLSRSLT